MSTAEKFDSINRRNALVFITALAIVTISGYVSLAVQLHEQQEQLETEKYKAFFAGKQHLATEWQTKGFYSMNGHRFICIPINNQD